MYLEQCRAGPIMVCVSGSLDPGCRAFGKYVEHFHRTPLFRAIPGWRFYVSESGKVRLKPAQVANVKLRAEADLALDTANPSLDSWEPTCS